MDHDQRFKSLIREFFGDLLGLFFADWAARFDFDRVEWLDKEVLPNPPAGSRHVLDLVAKLHVKEAVAAGRDDSLLALVHVEIESPDRTAALKPRLPSYYVHLRDTYDLPVLPVVIYLKVGLDGIGIDLYAEQFWELEVLSFRYLYVGLPALDGLEYARGDNWLGVALSALMRVPRDQVIALGREAYRRLTEAPLTEQQRFLLTDCLEAYLPLDDAQRAEFQRQLASEETGRVQTMNKTTYDRGMEAGIEKGIEKGRRDALQHTLLRQGTHKFGAPSEEIQHRIRSVPEVAALEELAERIIEARSWDDLWSTMPMR